MPKISFHLPYVISIVAPEIRPLEIEMPEQVSQNEPELEVAQVLANAAAGAEAKRLARLLVVRGVPRLVLCVLEPALGHELVWSRKVVGRVRRRPRVDRDRGPAGNELAGHGVAALGDGTREAGRYRREDAQGFVDAGIHVCQLLQSQKRHGLGFGKVGSDLCC